MTNQLLTGVFGLALMGGVLLDSQEAEAQEKPPKEIVDPNPGGDDRECKIEQISCGWFSDDRMVCHVNGNDLTCNCGDSTECD
ncbi:MAG: hypothetical protein ACQESK_03505 [Bacteroidota bacterium]